MDQKPRTISIIVFSLALLALIAALVYRERKSFTKFAPSETPGEVVGGSIFLRWNKNVTQPSSCPDDPTTFCAYGGDTTQLDFSNLPGMTQMTVTDGWRIHITDNPGGKGEKEDVLRVCSDINCSLNPGNGTTFYVKPGGTEVVAQNPPPQYELHFHDKDCGGVNEDLTCDKAVHFRFDFGTQKQQSVVCDSSGGKECVVSIGKK